MWTIVFVADIITYALVGVSLSEPTLMRDEDLNQSYSVIYYVFFLVNLLVFVSLFNT